MSAEGDRFRSVRARLVGAETMAMLSATWLEEAFNDWTPEQQRMLEVVVSRRLLELAAAERERQRSAFAGG